MTPRLFSCVSLLLQVQQLTATVILLATVLLLCPLSSSFSELAAFSAAYGLVFGATVAIHITVLAEVVGVQQLGSALGFFMLIRSSGGLLGPPIAGEGDGCFDVKQINCAMCIRNGFVSLGW